ncbi:hypothetical protein DFH08DRAFT_816173 [Mycena albidolilacea]|uniref:Uncharacterized protein n=1 Tax=Mycena albidolilacea TaxID=1033008 RepID=A0AAD6ZLA7_9AGAR|nr:hypothetical protein DFH08DRAFT_816159 [Mycena albidolilacea]KAJ7328012.1 hypothetical protein DFH08DRAFT_816173 [Mycena albidolilacea]
MLCLGISAALPIAEYVLDSRVQWHRAHADMEGWQEEVEIFAQESHHAIQGFNKMETVWTALAHDHQEDPGKKAYALKKANMYQEMGQDVQDKFAKVGGTWPELELVLPNTSNLSAQIRRLIGMLA